MKFKKDDLGLYIAFALVGGGLGLLAGAVLTNWIEKRVKEAREETEEEEPEIEIANVDHIREQQAQRKEVEELSEDLEYKVKEPKERRSHLARPNLSSYSDEELEDFNAEHQPNAMMMEMLRTGHMTMDQVLGVIEEEEKAFNQEPVNYSEPYHQANVEEAEEEGQLPPEEIEDRVQDLGIINDRFHILTGPPENAYDLSHKQIQWDPEDNSFYWLRRGQPMVYNINTGIGEDTWAIVEPYLLRGLTDIFVVDLETTRYYEFHKLPSGLGEDDPEVNAPE